MAHCGKAFRSRCSRTVPGRIIPLRFQGDAQSSGAPSGLDEAFSQLAALQEAVDAGKVIPKFGERAQEVVSRALGAAGSMAPEVERAMDGALEALFLRQTAIIRAEVVASFAGAVQQPDALEMADESFVQQTQALRRPGSSWNLEPDRQELKSVLSRTLRRSAALSEERARAAQMQQATVEVIGKLQEQMEQLQQKVQGARGGGSPWVLSTSYRVPKTPLEISGKYEQGRANIELTLTPDRVSSDSESGFMSGIGPANLGVSFNLGI